MSRNQAGAVVAVLAALGCSACASTPAVHQSVSESLVLGHTRFALPPAANRVIVPTQRGAGNQSLGSFTAAGTVYLEFSCTGKGDIAVAGFVDHVGPCDGSPTGAVIPGREGERIHLTVHTKPGTTWRFTAGEHMATSARR